MLQTNGNLNNDRHNHTSKKQDINKHNKKWKLVLYNNVIT